MQEAYVSTAQQHMAILASVDADGVEFALPAAAPGEFKALERIDAHQCPTFTDALMRYAAGHRIALRDCRLIMSIAGAVIAKTVRTTNGRWFISLSGLQAVTSGAPLVVNDVGATAWATADQPRTTPFGRAANVRPADVGRHAVVYAGRGLGAACVDRNSGRVKIGESEAGHIPFAVQSEADWNLASASIRRHGEASYERVICDLMENAEAPLQKSGDRDERLTELLANYCATIALTFAAWDGLYLTGHLFDRIAGPLHAGAFRTTFEGRGKMRGMLGQVPIRLLQLPHSSLSGLSILHGRTLAN